MTTRILEDSGPKSTLIAFIDEATPRCSAPRVELRRASCTGGIVRKIVKNYRFWARN